MNIVNFHTELFTEWSKLGHYGIRRELYYSLKYDHFDHLINRLNYINE
jgi:hypothetical protein